MSKYTKEEILQHRAEWVAALRSGKYEQTRNKLRDNKGYCCLGVACEVAGISAEIVNGTRYLYDGARLNLPASVAAWLGVTNAEPWSARTDGAPDYTVLNDEEGYTFEQIADHFEQYGFHPSIDVLASEETSE